MLQDAGRYAVSGPLDTGAVRIAATIGDGRVVSAAVRSDRPRGLATVLARHAPAAVPDLARRLFALCGMSQSVAAALALRMAGASVDAPPLDTAMRLLAAERIAEHLQATFIGWGTAVPPDRAEAASIPRALAAMRGTVFRSDALAEALDTLGFSDTIRDGSWADRLLMHARKDGADPAVPDPLVAADDAAVLAALDGAGEAFAAAPYLPGRRPETGAAARAAARGIRAALPAERLSARFAEIIEAARFLYGTSQLVPADWITMGQLELGVGSCAVETPRGRLHHLVRLDSHGTIARYLILAPTEWNFAGDGPFATALRSLRIVEIAAARPAIERLASLYDPCVACVVGVHQRTAGDDRSRAAEVESA